MFSIGDPVATLPAIQPAQNKQRPVSGKLRWAIAVSALIHVGGLWGLAASYRQPLIQVPEIAASNDTETILLRSATDADQPIAADAMLQESAVTILPHQAIMGSHVFHETSATDVPLDELLAPSETELTLADDVDPVGQKTKVAPPVISLLTQIIETLGNDQVPEIPAEPTIPSAKPSTAEASTTLTPPDLNGNALPRYPERARQLGWQGRVLLRIWINEQGKVFRVQVEESSGYGLLDAAATTSVRGWNVKPAQRNGQPVAGSWLLPIRFRQP
jgi:TonB family protein